MTKVYCRSCKYSNPVKFPYFDTDNECLHPDNLIDEIIDTLWDKRVIKKCRSEQKWLNKLNDCKWYEERVYEN